MEPAATDASRPEGSVRSVGTMLLALFGTRIELLGVELREESLRAQRLLVIGAVAAFFLGAALVLAGILFVVALWDSHRLLALGALIVLYGGLGIGLLLHIRLSARKAPLPFSATAREIEADLELLRQTSSNSR
jgi:uncharacterized membrane protein YqjE